MSDSQFIDRKLTVFDWFWLCYIATTFSIVASFLLPCCSCNKKYCRKESYPAVSDDCYKEVLKARGYDPKKKHNGRALWELIMRRDLMAKVVWHDDKWLDFFHNVRINHPCLSVFYVHRLHPFSRSNRLLILTTIIICDVAATLTLLHVLTLAFQGVELSWTEEKLIGFAASFAIGIILYLVQLLIEGCTTCACADRCCWKCCRSLLYLMAKSMILTLVIVSGIALGACVYYAYFYSNIADEYQTNLVFWRVFLIQYFIGICQAWFLIDLGHLYFWYSRHWSKIHNITEKVEIKQRGCCMRMFCFFGNILKWVCCGLCICSSRCCVWMFCPKSDKDVQDEFGINYREYKAWVDKEDIGQREIPYKRLGTQNYFYAAMDEDDRFEDEDYEARSRFNSVDFLVKDLKVGVENHIQLAYITEEKTNKNENEDDNAGDGDEEDGNDENGAENGDGTTEDTENEKENNNEDTEAAGDSDGQHVTNETVILKVDEVEQNDDNEELIAGQDGVAGNTAIAGTDSDNSDH